MLCSKCSNTVKPVVAIDIDGTLGDYHKHFLEFAHKYLGSERTYTEYDGTTKHSEWFCRTFGVDLRTFRDIKLAYRQGGMKRFMPVFPGAKGFVARVRSAGSEVWLTTTRPYLRVDNIDPDTREWLRRNEILYDGLLYDERKYEALIERVERDRIVAVLDDDMEEFDNAWRDIGPNIPLLYQSTSNRGVEAPSYVTNYEAALALITKRIDVWRETN